MVLAMPFDGVLLHQFFGDCKSRALDMHPPITFDNFLSFFLPRPTTPCPLSLPITPAHFPIFIGPVSDSTYFTEPIV